MDPREVRRDFPKFETACGLSLEEVRLELQAQSKDAVHELRTLRSPPEGIKRVVDGVYLVIQDKLRRRRRPSWGGPGLPSPVKEYCAKGAKRPVSTHWVGHRALQDPDFLDICVAFDPKREPLESSRMTALKHCLMHSSVRSESMGSAMRSALLPALFTWLATIYAASLRINHIYPNRPRSPDPAVMRNIRNEQRRTRRQSIVSTSRDTNGLPISVGDRVVVRGESGKVCFIGETQFNSEGIWLGIELDERAGKNRGSVGGVRYFECAEKHGIFVRPCAVARENKAPRKVPAPSPSPPRATVHNAWGPPRSDRRRSRSTSRAPSRHCLDTTRGSEVPSNRTSRTLDTSTTSADLDDMLLAQAKSVRERLFGADNLDERRSIERAAQALAAKPKTGEVPAKKESDPIALPGSEQPAEACAQTKTRTGTRAVLDGTSRARRGTLDRTVRPRPVPYEARRDPAEQNALSDHDDKDPTVRQGNGPGDTKRRPPTKRTPQRRRMSQGRQDANTKMMASLWAV